jgi:hypothetical protein
MKIKLAIIVIIILLFCVLLFIPNLLSFEAFVIFAFIIVCLYNLSINNEKTQQDRIILGGKEKKNYMKMSLMDPKHNIREIAKQLILLEDHMAHKPKRCIDCLTKHYLMVEGLLEEAILLDKTGEHHKEINRMTEVVKPTMMHIIELIKNDKINDDEYHLACQKLREIRKEVALKYVLNT